MQRTTRVCRRHTPAQREKILAAYHQSGLTQKSFASQSGIGYSTLALWLRKAASAKKESAPSTLVSVPNLFSASSPAPAFRLEFPGGVILEVASGFRPEELSFLLQEVRTR